MRFWIDIATAPQATFFSPIVAELERRGHESVITMWDRGQTRELTLATWPDAVGVGTGFSQSILNKGTAIWARARHLVRHIRPAAADVALSHNSYAQIVAGRSLRMPTVTAMDYEYQPANHLAFRLAHHVILPEAIPFAAVRRYGCSPARVLRYPGLKEEITLSSFRPRPDFRASIGMSDEQPLITVRPPAEGALYHRHGNPELDVLLGRLATSEAQVLVSPRTRTQGDQLDAVAGLTVLRQPVSGPDLLFHSDLFIGAGGTMTREAAILGTTTYSIFKGRRPAVDQVLIDDGKLRVLDHPEDLDPAAIEVRDAREWEPDPKAVPRFVDCVLEAMDRVRTTKRRPRRLHTKD